MRVSYFLNPKNAVEPREETKACSQLSSNLINQASKKQNRGGHKNDAGKDTKMMTEKSEKSTK